MANQKVAMQVVLTVRGAAKQLQKLQQTPGVGKAIRGGGGGGGVRGLTGSGPKAAQMRAVIGAPSRMWAALTRPGLASAGSLLQSARSAAALSGNVGAANKIAELQGLLKNAAVAAVIWELVKVKIESDPLTMSFLSGLIPELRQIPGFGEYAQALDFLKGNLAVLTNAVTAFKETASKALDMGRAQMRLGGNVSVSGGTSFARSQFDITMQQRLLDDKVRNEYGKQVADKLGESLREGLRSVMP